MKFRDLYFLVYLPFTERFHGNKEIFLWGTEFMNQPQVNFFTEAILQENLLSKEKSELQKLF